MADCSSAILLSVQGKKNKFKSYWSWSGSNFFWQDCWRSICLKFEKRITIRAIQQLCETLPKLKFVRNQLIFLMFLLNKPITRQRLVYQIMTDLRTDGGTDLLTGVGARDVTASKNRLLFKKDWASCWARCYMVCGKTSVQGKARGLAGNRPVSNTSKPPSLSLRTKNWWNMIQQSDEKVFHWRVSPSHIAWQLCGRVFCLFRLQMRVMWSPSCLWCGSITMCGINAIIVVLHQHW